MASKALIAILILALIVIAVAAIWTNLTQGPEAKPVQKAIAEGKLYVRIVKPVHDTGNLKITIVK